MANQKRLILIFLGISVIASLLVIPKVQAVSARQGITDWANPILLFESNGEIYTPIVLADVYGYVHVLWLYNNPDQYVQGNSIKQIYYAQWDGNTWSAPVDIIANPHINSISAAVDNKGFLHLVWLGLGSNYYYSRSVITDSTRPKNWSVPKILAQGNPTGHLYSGPKGRLYLAYPGTGTSGAYYIYSDDGGASWTSPQNIVKPQSGNSSLGYTFLTISGNKTIHVVWTEFQLPQGWPPKGVYYLHSTDDGRTWSQAVQIAGEGYDQINIAARDDGTVHLCWNGMVGVDGRYHSWSTDDGMSWSTTQAIVPSGATSGPPQLIIDQTGVLHLLTTFAGVWYGTWSNQSWSPLQNIAEAETNRTSYIEEAVMTLSGGNQLHAVYWADRKRLWYTSRLISAPSIPTQVFQTETPVPKLTDQVTPPIKATELPTVQFNSSMAGNEETNTVTPGFFILLGAVPPIGLILALWFLKHFRKK